MAAFLAQFDHCAVEAGWFVMVFRLGDRCFSHARDYTTPVCYFKRSATLATPAFAQASSCDHHFHWHSCRPQV
jgi:hypothetical protein